MVNLLNVKSNLEQYYKKCLMASVGCYSLVSNVEDLGDFYDIFSRHCNILKCFREEMDEFFIDVDLGIENPMVFEDDYDYLSTLEEYVANMRVINRVLKKSFTDLVLTSKCINLYENSKELGEEAPFMLKEGNEYKAYSTKELWEKINSKNKINYDKFVKVQYVKK